MGCNLFKIIMGASHMTRYKIEGHLKPKNLYEDSVEGQLKASKDIKKLVHETTFFNGSQNK